MQAIDHQVKLHDMMPLIREQFATGNSVRFMPQGISMLPMLRQGRDSVLLSPLPDVLKKYDLPLYRRDDGKYVLHRIIDIGETFTCIGDNTFEKETGLRRDQMIGLVTAFYRGTHEISVKNPAYLLYCRIWHYSRPIRHFWRRGIGWIRRHLR